MKFGLIPELVGRVPVTVSLELLDKEDLIRILTEPKNAIVKQYQKLLELDDVELEFDRKDRSKTGKCIRKSDVWKWVLTVKARSIHFYLTGEKTI